ncbi:4,5-DOPA dioxygenase extradiol [Leptospira ilyithenensis]|uniref:4,5-DOPA dioxygenase extradiol n=1 Tax=Leptospira ilyithenensis TaxID=2484901 RepID=A0A4R9LNB1_9LEPT|nr:4,5-DOPA dioxygenase extradiol [Leptospira ilyithenensis]TGN06470.1 4,5-DOPA dioxygenase extradiol [Leptospira ilyithenensis]
MNTNKMPVLFVGHGSPMNAVESNSFTKVWNELGKSIPKPKAIVCVSAHWLTEGTYVTAMGKPKTIHDFYGFPKQLMEYLYEVPGDPILADKITKDIPDPKLSLDQNWGLDHGTWSVLCHIYPERNIPVLQISIDATKDLAWHLEFTKKLSYLRREEVLIIGSGNLVHNLGLYNWKNPDEILPWAKEANDTFKTWISENNTKAFVDSDRFTRAMFTAIPTAEHYIPAIYALGLREPDDKLEFFNDVLNSSISMTGFRFG